MNESGQGVLCGMASGLDRCGSGQAPNVNNREDAGNCCEDVTSRTGWKLGTYSKHTQTTHFRLFLLTFLLECYLTEILKIFSFSSTYTGCSLQSCR